MNCRLRSCLAYLSLFGFVASATEYVIGFNESMVDHASLALVPLFFIVLIMFAILYVTGDSALRSPTAFWNGIPGVTSPRMVLLQRLLAIGAWGHVAWTVWQSTHGVPGVPAILDGQYVLESNGKVFGVITRSEYMSRHAGLFRASAFLLGDFYFLPLSYWWNQRSAKK